MLIGQNHALKTVLFLCSGNYYRSRFAEHFFNWHAKAARLPWRADSKGLAVGRCGNIGPISRHAIGRLNKLGIPINNNARFPEQAAKADLASAACIIAMKEAGHRELLKEFFPAWAHRVEYWHIDDLDCAEPDEALSLLETEVLALFNRLGSE